MIPIAVIFAFIKAHRRRIAAVTAVLLLIGIILTFRGCDEPQPPINEKEIQEAQQEIQEREDEKLSNTIQRSNETVEKAVEPVKRAEANTRAATNKNYSNTTADELKRKANEVYK